MKVSIQRIALRDLEANPYRHIEKYKIQKEKVDRLIASYDESGFWDGSIQARPHPTKTGKYQIAFGHHRLEAARRAKLPEIGVVVSKRDNATMIRMMASENAEEWSSSPLITQETIGAVIQAYADGEIELDPVKSGEGTRGGAQHGVYFVFADANTKKAYTLTTVAKFLNWLQKDNEPTRNCRIAFEAWHAAQDLGVDVKAYQDDLHRSGDGELLTNKATEAILTAARTAQRQAKRAGADPSVVKQSARKAAEEVVKDIKEKGSARATKDGAGRVGKGAANRVLAKSGMRVDPKAPPPLPSFVAKMAEAILDRTNLFLADVEEKIGAAMPFRDQVPDSISRELVKVLRAQGQEVQGRLKRIADEWERRDTRNVTPTRKRLTA